MNKVFSDTFVYRELEFNNISSLIDLNLENKVEELKELNLVYNLIHEMD